MVGRGCLPWLPELTGLARVWLLGLAAWLGGLADLGWLARCLGSLAGPAASLPGLARSAAWFRLPALAP